MAGELTLAVIYHLDLPRLAGSHGFLAEGGDGAAARGKGLMYHEGLVAGVLKGEDASLNLVFGELAEVVRHIFKFDDSLCVCQSHAAGYDACQKQCCSSKTFHKQECRIIFFNDCIGW